MRAQGRAETLCCLFGRTSNAWITSLAGGVRTFVSARVLRCPVMCDACKLLAVLVHVIDLSARCPIIITTS